MQSNVFWLIGKKCTLKVTEGYTSGVYAMYNLHGLSLEYMNSLLINIL